MSKTIKSELISLGLSEKVARVYIALLTIGTAKVKELVSETGLNRSTIYVVLDQLMKKGFASISNTRGVHTYSAVSPEQVIEAMREDARKNVIAHQALEALVPELERIHRSSRFKPRIEVFDGTRGLKKAFEEAINNKEKIMRVFSSTEDIFRSLPEYLPTFVANRLKQGIKMYGIHPDDYASRQMLKTVPNAGDNVTLIPRDKFSFPSDFAVWDDSVAFMSHRPPFSVRIMSKEIAEVTKVLVDLAQVEAKRYGL